MAMFGGDDDDEENDSEFNFKGNTKPLPSIGGN